MQWMMSAGGELEPTVIGYCCILSALRRRQEYDEAHSLFTVMREQFEKWRNKPTTTVREPVPVKKAKFVRQLDSKTYAIMIQVYLDAGESQRAIALFNEWITLPSADSDLLVYTSVIKGKYYYSYYYYCIITTTTVLLLYYYYYYSHTAMLQ